VSETPWLISTSPTRAVNLAELRRKYHAAAQQAAGGRKKLDPPAPAGDFHKIAADDMEGAAQFGASERQRGSTIGGREGLKHCRFGVMPASA
jgi:hypothetical protein